MSTDSNNSTSFAVAYKELLWINMLYTLSRKTVGRISYHNNYVNRHYGAILVILSQRSARIS